MSRNNWKPLFEGNFSKYSTKTITLFALNFYEVIVDSAFGLIIYLTIRLRARVFYEQIVNEVQPSWLSLVENEGE